jgi:hypothetical protein
MRHCVVLRSTYYLIETHKYKFDRGKIVPLNNLTGTYDSQVLNWIRAYFETVCMESVFRHFNKIIKFIAVRNELGLTLI